MQQLVLVQDGKHKYMSCLLSSELLWLYRSTDVLAGTVLHPDTLHSTMRVRKSLRGGPQKMKGHMVHMVHMQCLGMVHIMHNCVCIVRNTHVSAVIQCTKVQSWECIMLGMLTYLSSAA